MEEGKKMGGMRERMREGWREEGDRKGGRRETGMEGGEWWAVRRERNAEPLSLFIVVGAQHVWVMVVIHCHPLC